MRRKKKLKRLVCFFEGLTLNLRKRERRKKKGEMVELQACLVHRVRGAKTFQISS
jgi:hypothetical protein